MASPKLKAPEKVAIVAMGMSHRDFVTACAVAGGAHSLFDEVWAINAMAGVILSDRVFMMDRPSYLINETKNTHDDCTNYQHWFKRVSAPVYTAFPEPDICPTSVAYPLEDVLSTIGFPYLNTTVAYAVAFAIHLGVKELSLFGCDFTYQNSNISESGRGCVEFLLGIAVSRGMQLSVAETSTLLDSVVPQEKQFYGYEGRVRIEEGATPGSIKVVIAENSDASHND
jgi:hypothetical protein